MRGARELPPGWSQRFAHASGAGEGARGVHHLFEARALLDSTLYAIPAEAIEDIPVVQWKLMETYERRLKSFRAELRFVWHDSYVVGHPRDRRAAPPAFRHDRRPGRGGGGAQRPAMGMMEMVESSSPWRAPICSTRRPLPPGTPTTAYEAALHEHAEFLRKVEGLARYLETAPVDALHTMVEFLKDWVIDHTLLENRRFRKVLA